jgi:hypothetical protein
MQATMSQGLKPESFCGFIVEAEASTYLRSNNKNRSSAVPLENSRRVSRLVRRNSIAQDENVCGLADLRTR